MSESIGACSDVEYQLSLVRRKPGQSDEDLAKVLYHTQMDVLSANAMCNLTPDDPTDKFQWDNLPESTRKGWLNHAATIK